MFFFFVLLKRWGWLVGVLTWSESRTRAREKEKERERGGEETKRQRLKKETLIKREEEKK